MRDQSTARRDIGGGKDDNRESDSHRRVAHGAKREVSAWCLVAVAQGVPDMNRVFVVLLFCEEAEQTASNASAYTSTALPLR